MFKIGEFSKLVRVSARMLRHYDKCGLFRPAQIDRCTGYRLYSAAQISALRRIADLRDMGFGIEEMEKILPHYGNAERMQKALGKKREQIAALIESEQSKLNKIAAMSEKIKKENEEMVYEVELKELPAVKVLSLRETIGAYENEAALWEKMGEFIAQNGIDCSMNGYSIYHDDDYQETDIAMEIAVPVNAAGNDSGNFAYKELAAIPEAATIRFSGPYENYNHAMEKLATWMERNGYEFAGNIRGHIIEGAHSQGSPSGFMTELQVPVMKTPAAS